MLLTVDVEFSTEGTYPIEKASSYTRPVTVVSFHKFLYYHQPEHLIAKRLKLQQIIVECHLEFIDNSIDYFCTGHLRYSAIWFYLLLFFFRRGTQLLVAGLWLLLSGV